MIDQRLLKLVSKMQATREEISAIRFKYKKCRKQGDTLLNQLIEHIGEQKTNIPVGELKERSREHPLAAAMSLVKMKLSIRCQAIRRNRELGPTGVSKVRGNH